MKPCFKLDPNNSYIALRVLEFPIRRFFFVYLSFIIEEPGLSNKYYIVRTRFNLEQKKSHFTVDDVVSISAKEKSENSF